MTIKLAILLIILVALPFILYGQFEKADRQTRTLLTGSIQHRSWLIAQALAPILQHLDGITNAGLNDVLAKFTQDGTTLRLMFRPTAMRQGSSFFFVASAPLIPMREFSGERDNFSREGILKSLQSSCSEETAAEFRYKKADGGQELLTSVVPIKTGAGCWALISTHDGSEYLRTSIGRPYWRTDGVRIAALVYVVFVGLAILVMVSVRRALTYFRTTAHEIRRGGFTRATFASRNIVPELSSVAKDFDHLVYDLQRTANEIREIAEDNAHAVKTPLAVIRSALEPLRRVAAQADARSQRAVQLIDSSLSRLATLVSAAQRLGNDTADFIEAPKLWLNFTMIIIDVLQHVRDLAREKNVNIVHRLAVDVHVVAPEGALDVILENIVDNAITFSKPNDTIIVTLSKKPGRIDLHVDDQGPGIDPHRIAGIFERYVSQRPASNSNNGGTAVPCHAGLGLWIVRRKVEALGGVVTAANRAGGGLTVRVMLPVNGT